MLEEWDQNRCFMLRGQRIPVHPSPKENLCIAGLPLTFTEEKFIALVKSFGDVNFSFLMVSEKSGVSKGYGFVEYKRLDMAMTAKMRIPCLVIEGNKLWAEFVDPKQTTLESLHSKCLYVYNLPPDYWDVGDLRKKFSVVVDPAYCEIAFYKTRPLPWGLVEYNTAEEAEETFYQLQNLEIKERRIKIVYSIPGVPALDRYMKLLTLGEPLHMRNDGVGLLPPPAMPSTYETLQNMRQRNPQFAQSVEDIMLSERGSDADFVEVLGPAMNEAGHRAGVKRIPSSVDPCPVPAKRSGQQVVKYKEARSARDGISPQMSGDEGNTPAGSTHSEIGSEASMVPMNWSHLIQFALNSPPSPFQYDAYLPSPFPGNTLGVTPRLARNAQDGRICPQSPAGEENVRTGSAHSEIGSETSTVPINLPYLMNTPPPLFQYDPYVLAAAPTVRYPYVPPSFLGAIPGVSPYPAMLPGYQTYSPPAAYWIQMQNIGVNGNASPDLPIFETAVPEAASSNGDLDAWVKTRRQIQMFFGGSPIQPANINSPANISTNNSPTYVTNHNVTPNYLHDNTVNNHNYDIHHPNKIAKAQIVTKNAIKQNAISEIGSRSKPKDFTAQSSTNHNTSNIYNVYSVSQAIRPIGSTPTPDLCPRAPYESHQGDFKAGNSASLPKPIGYERKKKNILLDKDCVDAWDPPTWSANNQIKYPETYFESKENK